MRPRLIVACLLLLSLASRAAGQPRVAVEQGSLVARLGKSVIDGAEVRQKLRSGLSTTFVVSARGDLPSASGRLTAASRIEVRYDLWDEVYVVTEYRPDRTVARARLQSLDALASWWDDHPIALAALAPGSQFRGELELRILPFSFSEERDAQGWVSRSLGLSTNTPVTDSTSPAPARGGLLDAMIATSIRAKPISVKRWRVSTGGARSR